MRELFDLLRDSLTRVCEHYERSAPTVATWANDLYIRMGERPDDVRLSELTTVSALYSPAEGWMHPNYAANTVYKLMARLRQDTTGHAGY